MATSKDPYDDAILRRIVIEELSEAEARKLAVFIRDVRGSLIARLDRLKDRKSMKARTISALLRQSNQIHNELYQRMRGQYREGAKSFAGDQADWRKTNISNSIDGVAVGLSTRQAVAAMDFNPAIGRHSSEWFRELKQNHQRRVAAAIRQSFAEGDSVASAAARIREVTDYNARGLRTFVRTSYSNIAANVDLATYKANRIEKYVWLSTLDRRTTPICSSRDGNRYVVGDGPMPPAHMNCRSTTYALTPETSDIRDETYDGWLRRQPDTVQGEIMGQRRAELFRADPEATVGSFVSRNGGWKTLDQLKVTPQR
jgi:SPP1 gp7 family putative phage head morphogenesis protein